MSTLNTTSGRDDTTRPVDGYLPVDTDITPAQLISYSRIVAGEFLCAGQPERISNAIRVTLQVDAIRALSDDNRSRDGDTPRVIRQLERQIHRLGGRETMADAPSFEQLQNELARRERTIYLVGHLVRLLLILRRQGRPAQGVEAARRALQEIFRRYEIVRSTNDGGDLVIVRPPDQTVRQHWTRFRRLASYCLVVWHYHVPVNHLLHPDGYESIASLTRQAHKVRSSIMNTIPKHAPGATQTSGEPRPYFGRQQILQLNPLKMGTEEGRQRRDAIKGSLKPNAAENEYLKSLSSHDRS